jgi:hypothetical protein
VDQTAGDVKTETEKPENQQNDKNCPEHIFLLMLSVSVKVVRLLSDSACAGKRAEGRCESAACCLQQGFGTVGGLLSDLLDPAKQQQNNYNDEHQTHATARGITPGTAVVPPRQGTHQKQHQ